MTPAKPRKTKSEKLVDFLTSLKGFITSFIILAGGGTGAVLAASETKVQLPVMSEPATKADLELVRAEFKGAMAEFKGEMKGDFKAVSVDIGWIKSFLKTGQPSDSE